MDLFRRKFLSLAAGAVATPAVSRSAWADTYPSRPVRFVVGYPAGNASDVLARLTGQWLSERLGQNLVTENRPGAGGNIAAELVVRAPPDGYTLLLVLTTNAMNATLYETLKFDFARDIAPVASICQNPYVMAVTPSFPAQTVPAFIAYAKSNPGKINMASAGIGGPTHVFGELFKVAAGADLVHVPYRGSFVPDLLGGQVQVVFAPITHLIAYIRDKKLRALAVTTATRSEALPDVPPLGDFLPGYEAVGWYGIGAPKGTPVEVIDKLNKETTATLGDAKFKARLADLGAVPMPMSSAEFATFISQETEKWARVIRTAKIKVE
ncbi:MAG: tripartite tricarboxylate transporter substrate binding protein [Hyphomicrobiales bacterium]|nr:tripartite tricarboxylate transporter substrate binding protein [Hyphomicrobiales bacterium]MBV9429668.1 tripartite tricarboxylate transporter substrate binding protein [Bradyrhizobiaceae bacterium]